MFDLNDFDNTGIRAEERMSADEREALRLADLFIASDGFEPDEQEMLDVAAMMAAHDENPFG